MITETEKNNKEKLFRLIEENPGLPVVPMVYSEIVADDGYAYWRGAFGDASVEEYFVGDERVHFRENDDPSEIDAALYDYLDGKTYDEIKTEAEETKAYAELPWTKAIIVYIELPEEYGGMG